MTFFSERCTRTYRNGAPCRHGAAPWPPCSGSGNPYSCRTHMTRGELERLWLHEEEHRYGCTEEEIRARTLIACHVWEEPSPTFDEQALASAVLREWQRARCAACGSDHERLQLDHCHRTGLIRGFLCRGCNISEGNAWADDPRWAAYRERPPAVILNCTSLYSGRGGRATPAPPLLPLPRTMAGMSDLIRRVAVAVSVGFDPTRDWQTDELGRWAKATAEDLRNWSRGFS